jgi:hypothetical protein
MWQILRKKAEMPTADRALPGRAKPAFAMPAEHYVNHHRIQPPFPAGLEQAMFGLGCFWGAERKFWKRLTSLDRRRLRRPDANRPTRKSARATPATQRW